MTTRYPPTPYSFLVRRCDELRSANIGFFTKSFRSAGPPWSEEIFGAIPARLSSGDSSVNSGRNVEYTGWDRLDKGGMGAELAADRTRYRYAAGLYCGDMGEIYAQPRERTCVAANGRNSTLEPSTCVLPNAQVGIVAASGHTTTQITLNTNDGAGFNVGCWVRVDSLTGAQQHTRITAKTGDVLTLSPAIDITGISVDWRVLQLAQQIKQLLPWMIPATTPDALTAPANIAVTAAGDKRDVSLLGANEKWFFVFTKLSPWGESLRSGPVMHTIGTTVQAIDIQFGSNSGSESADGVTYAANTRDYAGVTGYVIYGYRGEAADTLASFNKDLLRKVATIGVRSNQQVNTPKPRHTFRGETLTEGQPPEYTAGTSATAYNKLIAIACDEQWTYFYEVTVGTSSTIALLAPVHDVDDSFFGRIVGTVARDSCTVWNGQLIVPTTNSNGMQAMARLWWDDSKATDLRFRARGMIGILGHLAYAEGTRRLWRCYKNLLWWSSDPFTGDPVWTGPIAVGTAEHDVKHMLSYGGAKNSSDSALYLTKANGLYRVLDTDLGPSNRAEWITDFGIPDTRYGSPLVEHRGELYIGAGTNMMRYTIGSFDLVGANRDRGLPVSLQGSFTSAVSTNRHLYVAVGHEESSMAAKYYGQILETEQGEAWHQFWCSVPTNALSFSESAAPDFTEALPGGHLLVVPANWVSNSLGPVLLHSVTAPAEQVRWQPLRRAGERLREAPAYLPREGGILVLPKYYADSRYIEKVWHWLQLAQSQRTVPTTLCQVRADVELEQPSRTATGWTPVTWNQNIPGGDNNYWLITADAFGAPSGYLYSNHLYRQEITGAERQRVMRSEGISLRIKLKQATASDTIPLVLEEIVLTSSEVSLSLGRWIFSCEMAMQTISPRGTTEDGVTAGRELDTVAEFWAARERLNDFARNSDPLVLTDAGGEEHIVRMDLGRIVPRAWNNNYQSDGTGFVEPKSLAFDVTFTELYNIDDNVSTFIA